MIDLSNQAINNLRHQARNLVRELGLLNDAYFEIGVTLAERHLLIELAGSSSFTMGEIAERLLLDKSTVSRLIAKAIKKGYLTCVTDEKDKRRRLIQMTEFGKQTLSTFEPIAFNQTKQALSTLTPEEIQTVYKGVALYAKGLKNSRMKAYTTSTKKEEKTLESLSKIYDRLNQMGYALRLFDHKDEKALYEIFCEVVDSSSQFPYEGNSLEQFRQQFFIAQGQVYVCHTLKGKVIGGFYLRANYTDRSKHIANAAYMIHHIYRGKGIGSLLIQASLHFAKKLGFQAIQFNRVLSQNTLAINLYKKLGFDIVGHLPQSVRNPDGSYQDSYIMHRKLDNI